MRDVRISDEVLAALSPGKVRDLRAGPDPGRTPCVTCGQMADADSEPISVVVIRHPTRGTGTVTNIVFAHAGCARSTLSDSDVVIDIAEVMGRMHLIPTLFGGESDDPPMAGLMMEPLFPSVEAADVRANAYLREFLSRGLKLLGTHDLDLDQLVPIPGWRAILTPGNHPGQTRVTIVCDGRREDRSPRIIASDVGVLSGERWLEGATASGTLALYAGLIGLRETTDRDTMTVVRAIGTAAQAGNLCGGIIEAVVIGP